MSQHMIPLLNLLLSAVVLLLLVYWMLGIKRRLRQTKRALAQLQDHVWNTALLTRMFPDASLPPPPSGFAAAGDLLLELVGMVRRDRPALVVELGSGLSTLLLAAGLREQGTGKLVSIEHDPGYASKTQRLIDDSGLADWVEIRIAPLRLQRISGRDSIWYDSTLLDDLTGINMLFVDGPPAPLARNIREPTLPFFWQRLASGGKAILDDAARDAEKQAINQWASAHPDSNVTWLPLQKGCAIVQKAK